MQKEKSDDIARLDAALQTLGEFFDTIQIFATRTQENSEGGGTVHCQRGLGNWFARYGCVKMWIVQNEGLEFREGLTNKSSDECSS